ncbi:hypothetical protein GOP47_0023769, partial [Adiantum capillus-veneris]
MNEFGSFLKNPITWKKHPSSSFSILVSSLSSSKPKRIRSVLLGVARTAAKLACDLP